MRALPLPLPATCDTTDVNLSTPAYTSCHRRGVGCRPSTFGSVLISLACACTTHRFVRGARALPGGGTRGRSASSSLVIDRCVHVLTNGSGQAHQDTLALVLGKFLSWIQQFVYQPVTSVTTSVNQTILLLACLLACTSTSHHVVCGHDPRAAASAFAASPPRM